MSKKPNAVLLRFTILFLLALTLGGRAQDSKSPT
jgi:hypothetical protein